MSAARPRIIDDADVKSMAENIRTTFTKKAIKAHEQMPFSWPATWRHVGDSLAIAYESDKWKKDGDYELYKHLAESRNRVMIAPSFRLVTQEKPHRPWSVIGSQVSFAHVAIPRYFAVLGFFEEADLRLHTAGTDDRPEFGRGKDDGVIQVRVRHAYVGGAKMPQDGRYFLFVYTASQGPLLFVMGTELGIEEDGIVG